MTPALVVSIFGDDTLFSFGVVVLIVSAVWNHFRAVAKLSLSIASTDATAKAAVVAVNEMKDVTKEQGIKLDRVVENTATMAVDIRHLAERQNGAVHREEFGALEKRVTVLETKGGG